MSEQFTIGQSLPPAPSEHSRRIEPQAEPAKPELYGGYRWVNIGERIIDTDEYLTSYGEWMQTGGLEFKCTVAKKYRRRIEPQAEPAKPERQASEMAKRAARSLYWEAIGHMITLAKNIDNFPTRESFAAKMQHATREYSEAYDYAKSIEAIGE